MNSSTNPLGPDFAKQFTNAVLEAMDQGKREAANMLWAWLVSMLKQDWFLIIGVLLFILFLSWLEAYSTRGWGWFGSVLYNYLFFGIQFIFGLVFGPEIFANDWYEIVSVILYGMCFWFVGQILSQMGFRKRHR